MTSRLTLNLGLRWQYDQSFHETHHGDAFFNPFTAEWEQFGVNGTPDTTLDPSKHQFEPRIGFAYNPRAGFVIRGGYGIMHPDSWATAELGTGNPVPTCLRQHPFPPVPSGTLV